MRGIEVGLIGRGISVIGPSLGRISGFPAPRMEGFSMSRINNPFLGVPKAPTYIENRGPSLLGPKVEAIKNPFRVAGWTSSVVRAPVPALVRLPNPTRGLDVRVITNPSLVPKIEATPKVNLQRKVEGSPASKINPATSTPVQEKTQVVGVTKSETTPVPVDRKTSLQERIKKKIFARRKRYVHHWEVTEKRISDIYDAINKTEEEGSITGIKVADYLHDHKGVRGEIVGENGPDGTFLLIKYGIKMDSTVHDSKDAALQRYLSIVYQHRPTKISQEGEPVTAREVNEAFMERKDLVVKPPAALAIITKRQEQIYKEVIKNGAVTSTIVVEKEEAPKEESIEHNPVLVELFPKAA